MLGIGGLRFVLLGVLAAQDVSEIEWSKHFDLLEISPISTRLGAVVMLASEGEGAHWSPAFLRMN